MLNIFCAFTPSDLYDPIYVYKLKHSIFQNLSLDHKFWCISEKEMAGINHIPLEEGLTGWWGKVQAFDPVHAEKGRIILMDIDQVITGNLDELFSDDTNVICTMDFGGEKHDKFRWPSQTVMSFAPGTMEAVWKGFNKDRDYWINRGNEMCAPKFGDSVLWELFDGLPVYYQDKHPGQIVSYKMHCGYGLPESAKIVSFHGKPKPHQVAHNWVTKHWV